MKKYINQFRTLTVFEIVFIMVISAAIGVSSWGWSLLFSLVKPFLRVHGLQNLISGFWILPSVFLPFIIRKPGVAIVASIMAAFIESLLTRWGIVAVMWGFVQGLGAEVVFYFFAYSNWKKYVLLLASISSCTFSFIIEYKFYRYEDNEMFFNLIQYFSYVFSSIVLAGFVTIWLTKKLIRVGLLKQYSVAKMERN